MWLGYATRSINILEPSVRFVLRPGIILATSIKTLLCQARRTRQTASSNLYLQFGAEVDQVADSHPSSSQRLQPCLAIAETQPSWAHPPTIKIDSRIHLQLGQLKIGNLIIHETWSCRKRRILSSTQKEQHQNNKVKHETCA